MPLLSTHFHLTEFTVSETAERLGIDNTPTPEALKELHYTAAGLEGVRVLLGAPIIITSGYRCLKLNRAIGSKDSSQHVKGQAVDFICPGYGSPSVIVARLMDSGIEFDQLIQEFANRGRGWVHVSFVRHSPRHEVLVIDETGTRPYMA